MTADGARAEPNHRLLDHRGIIGFFAPMSVLAVLFFVFIGWLVHSRNAVRLERAREALAHAEAEWRFEQLRDPRLTNVHLDARIVGDRWYVDAEPIDDERPFDDAMRAEVASFVERTRIANGVAWRGEAPPH